MRPRIVLDTNLFLAGLLFGSSMAAQILESLREEKFILLTCQELFGEIERKVSEIQAKKKIKPTLNIDYWLGYLESNSEIIEPKSSLKLCRDPKDDYLINLAIDGQAEYLVTRDEDIFAVEHLYIQSIVVSPENFMPLLRDL